MPVFGRFSEACPQRSVIHGQAAVAARISCAVVRFPAVLGNSLHLSRQSSRGCGQGRTMSYRAGGRASAGLLGGHSLSRRHSAATPLEAQRPADSSAQFD